MLGDPKTKKWSCCQVVDGQLIEIDPIFSTRDLHVLLVMDKYEHSMPVGLDHRCVHCPLQSCVGKGKNGRDAFHLRTGGHNWIVIMHQHNIRTISFSNCKLQVGLRLIQWKQYLEEGVRFSKKFHQIILVNQFFFGIQVLICTSSYSHNFTYIEILAFRHVLDARKLKERACPELLDNSILGIEVGGRWSEETASFITTRARTKTRDIPAFFRHAATSSLISRWTAFLTQAAFTISMASPLPPLTSSHNSRQTPQTPAASPHILPDSLVDLAFAFCTSGDRPV